MGLDMYLRAEKYVSGYDFRPQDDQSKYRQLVELFGVEDTVDPDTPSATVSFTIGYWRKANHIHNWFVENVQDGVDECQESFVSREQLRDLRKLCKRVLKSTELIEGHVLMGTTYSSEHPEGRDDWNPGKVLSDARLAEELLPTTSGFFFGGTAYDEWYWRDLERTVEIIDKALVLPDDWDFEYQSSW